MKFESNDEFSLQIWNFSASTFHHIGSPLDLFPRSIEALEQKMVKAQSAYDAFVQSRSVLGDTVRAPETLGSIFAPCCISICIYIYIISKNEFPRYIYIYTCMHAIGIFQLPQRTKNHLPVHALVNIVKLDVCMQAQQCIASIRVTYTSIPACMLLYIHPL